MKKLFVYFFLISSLFCEISSASSNKGGSNINNKEWAIKTEPYIIINMIFNNENGLKNYDLREKDKIIALPRAILNMYPNRPDLQEQVIDTLGQCMKNQTINSQRKYTNKDIRLMITYSKIALDLQ